MSDLPINNPDERNAFPRDTKRDAKPATGVERSFALASVLKSLVNPERGGAAKNGVIDVGSVSGWNVINGTLPPTPVNAPVNSQIEIEDWDSLFGAVEERLRDTVEELEPGLATTPSSEQDKASRIKDAVLDCVSALDKLHRALRQERSTQARAKPNGTISDAAVASPLTNGHDPSQNN